MTLAEAFQKGDGRRIVRDGQRIYSCLRFTVNDGDVLQLTRVSSSPTRAQALKLAADKAQLRANGVLLSTAAIWSHTAPERVRLQVVGRRARTLDVWNAWSLDGVDSSWIGNAGMVVESKDQTHVIRCSDGVGSASFDDLVIRLNVAAGD